MDKKEKTIFIIRAILWFLFYAIAPFVFICWRYGIFTDNSMRLSGLGLVGIVILVLAIIKLSNYIYKGLDDGMLKQCLHGFITTVVPLIAIYVILVGVSNNIKTFELALGFTILCETIAIPLDPFPKWLKSKENGKFETLTDIAINKFFERKKNGSK